MNNIYFEGVDKGIDMEVIKMNDGLTIFEIQDLGGLQSIRLNKTEVSKLIEFLQAIDK